MSSLLQCRSQRTINVTVVSHANGKTIFCGFIGLSLVKTPQYKIKAVEYLAM